ncbi:MAG: hypothetical protein A3H51_00690 [Candidatus Spechtbacteria bacterium RIFCSPLOWO2_02_FULL_38_8]|uniref:ZIP zinc transporter n=1 Tax=Candidatus Spechtbacteria bacterium RIFCSPLOWO2_02_FULL_38_8 TaxID=1802164 RepID=A0A1G2HJK6_9BACT|nr:MAG: hypothetical protein A3H51_00690 [Candidatus Spechtbacteria bacterium RIFCSPLOWO2_02_FULL_38_8]
MLFWILLFSLLGSVFSTVGGVFLLLKRNFAQRISLFLITFAAGVLLAVAFSDLLPEAAELFGDVNRASAWVLGAIVVLFITERFLWWYHHHRMDTREHPHHAKKHVQPTHAYLLMIGDTIHNFIDGLVIAASFMVSFPLGVSVSLGVVAHELPQEIADFGIMVGAGFSRLKTLLLNLATALATLVGAVTAYFILGSAKHITPYLLAIGAGVFIYIALSDLIPVIHHQSEHKHDVLHFVLFIFGILFIFWIGLLSGV